MGYEAHRGKTQTSGRQWTKCLLKRVDFHGWRLDKEFLACAYNIFLRRDQMRSVRAYVSTSTWLNEQAHRFHDLNPQDLLVAAYAAPDADHIRKILRNSEVASNVKEVLRSMFIAMRQVEGSDAWRSSLQHLFAAMRIWGGSYAVFFTLNPNDTGSPLTLVFGHGSEPHTERISLDYTDQEMAT